LASVLAVCGAGALLGSSLGVVPVLAFIILLSIYDLTAVFYTKHMVTMAKAIVKRKLAFTVAMPTKVHTFQLGTGDLFVPLMLSVSAYGALGLIQALSVIIGAFFGFLILFLYSSRKPGTPLPALPPVCAFSSAFLAVSIDGQII
jgi:presenilin-like A22 family membrane protease